ncbi:DUF5518 domain-containing protein [Halorubrum sp. DTA98]|uniref:DUF5518 domain-containing protein n=1 Tax=Halorubrum sp. DTA98 TaxID=3402163 RepID=UPI003AABB702
MGVGDTWINAIVGAVITVGLSFTSFSPLLGGGVASYLQSEPPARGANVGTISGVIAAMPLFVIMTLGFALLAAVPSESGGFHAEIELVLIFGLILSVMFGMILSMMLLWSVGLSTVGGYVGAYIHMESR